MNKNIERVLKKFNIELAELERILSAMPKEYRDIFKAKQGIDEAGNYCNTYTLLAKKLKCEHHNAKNQIKYAEKAFKDVKLVVETLKMTPEIVNMEMEDNGDNNMEVDILDISVRAYYCLKRAKITTLKQLSEMTINEFINKTNSIGRSVLPELCKKLKENGLSFYRKKIYFLS